MDSQVFFETWDDDRNSFEFAHFSEEDIADAIRSACAARHDGNGLTLSDLLATLSKMRVHRENLKRLLTKRGLSKLDLAIELWPALERKLRAADSRSAADQIPVARILLRADELARNTLRHSGMILRTLPAPLV